MIGGHVAPLLELTRGNIVESTHYGSIAVVDARGLLLHSVGDANAVAFLRSSAKPFQALPFFEYGGPERLGLTLKEQALLCASHEGSDEHVRVAASIQAKADVHESDLQCGLHMPGDATAYKALIARGETPTPNRNNCSGKHSGMLAYARLRGWPLDTYLEMDHPVQQEILTAIAEFSGCRRDEVQIGIDGCSAPNFAMPLRRAALAYARLCDPTEMRMESQQASQKITQAMTTHPEMISGVNEFDCRLMLATGGRMVCKRGAEGYQAIGIMPGVISEGSPGIGVAFKVSDGDLLFRTISIEPRNRVRPAVTLEILRQMGALRPEELNALADFGPSLPVKNNRGEIVGISRPVFQLSPGT